MAGPSILELNRITDAVTRALLGAIRRMAVTVTSKPLWQVVGHVVDGVAETLQAEPFTGIGFYARPPSTGKPEAIAVFVGGAKAPAIVATRDEKTRAAVAGGVGEGEAMAYVTDAVVYLRSNGTVEIRSPGGAAVPLATLADVQALRDSFNNHGHSYTPGPGSPVPTPGPVVPTGGPLPYADAPTGTTVLKGE